MHNIIHYLLQPGSRFYFPMDEMVGNRFQGDVAATLHNNPTLVAGILGKALSFDGINQWTDLGLQP